LSGWCRMKKYEFFVDIKYFTETMNVMADVFPSINSKGRFRHYYSTVEGMPAECLRDISTQFLMSSRQMPLPEDFKAAVTAWKRNNNYFEPHEQSQENKIECLWCYETGILKIQFLDDSKFQTLMRCDCKFGDSCNSKFPRWDVGLGNAAKKIALNPLSFKPSENEGGIYESLMIKAKKWNEFKFQAETFWREKGYA